MRPFESDGLTAIASRPWLWCCGDHEQVSAVLRYCHSEGIKVVPRGAGNLAVRRCAAARRRRAARYGKFNRIKDIDFEHRVAVVERASPISRSAMRSRMPVSTMRRIVLADRLHLRRQRGERISAACIA